MWEEAIFMQCGLSKKDNQAWSDFWSGCPVQTFKAHLSLHRISGSVSFVCQIIGNH